MTTFFRTPRAWLVPIAAAVLLSGCSSASPHAAGGTNSAAHQAAATQSPAEIVVSPANHAADVRIDAPLTVNAVNGNIDSVTVHEQGSDTPVAGTLQADSSIWKANDTLDPATVYTVEATASGHAGDSTSARTTFTTASVKRLTTAAQPSDGDTVGVGMPVILRFNANIPSEKQAAVLSHVQVTSTPVQKGAWHWFAPDEAHWRPEKYWTSGTKVSVVANLKGVEGGDNVWGLGNWSENFSIGDQHISTFDAAAHQMTVTSNGQQVNSWPISAGRPRNPTIGGTLIVRYKQQDVLMDSRSIGIPRTSSDGYYEHVYWDTAISLNGFFIHAAPWSESQQGRVNVSHGCVNLTPGEAQTFYNFSMPGDIVIGSNTGRTADAGDGEGDWQIPFDQWPNSGGTVTPPSTSGAAGGI